MAVSVTGREGRHEGRARVKRRAGRAATAALAVAVAARLGAAPAGAAPAQAPAPASPAPAAQATAAAPLTLQAAIDRALAANPRIAAARLQRPVDLAGVDVARERPNPDVEYDTERETPRQALTATLPIEL